MNVLEMQLIEFDDASTLVRSYPWPPWASRTRGTSARWRVKTCKQSETSPEYDNKGGDVVGGVGQQQFFFQRAL